MTLPDSPDALTMFGHLVRDDLASVPDPVPSSWLEAWRREDIELLAVHHLGPLRPRLAAPERARVSAAARAACAREMARQALVRQVLELLDAAGVRALVLKGTALACALYPEAWLRPRLDCDLLVAAENESRAASVVIARGWCELPSVPGLTGQRSFRDERLDEVIDLHTRLLAPAAFRGLDDFEGLWSRSRPLPSLGPAARWLGLPDALLHACVHRVAHHNDSRAPLWLYDIHLLASRFDGQDWRAFTDAAARTGTRAVCRSGLRAAGDLFGTCIPEDARVRLDACAGEPTAAFLGGRLSEARLQHLNVTHLATWRDRLELVRRHLLPPRAYMQWKYGVRHPALLPWFYVRRIAAGAPRWLRRLETTSPSSGLAARRADSPAAAPPPPSSA